MKQIICEWKEWLIGLWSKTRLFFSSTAAENGTFGPSPFQAWLAHVRKNICNRNMPYFWITCGMVFLLLFGVMLRASVPQPAISYGVLGVQDISFAQQGYFELSGVSGLETEYIQENLRLSPRAAFTVERRGEDNVRIQVTRHKDQPYTVIFTLPDGVATEFEINSNILSVELLSGSAVSTSDTVVLAFSQPVDADTFEEGITLTPSIPVQIEVDGALVYMTPVSYWSTGTTYRLTFDKAFASLEGTTFGSPTTLSWNIHSSPSASTQPATEQPTNQTPTKATSFSYQSPESRMWRSDEPLTWEFSAQNLSAHVPVVINTYRMGSVEKYRDQAGIFQEYDVDLNLLERVDSNVYLVKNGINTLSAANPGLGAYISEICYTQPGQNTETKIRQPFLVTDLTVYMQSSGDEALLWLNHYQTGQALSGYQISVVGEEAQILTSGTTNAQGVALMDIDFSHSQSAEDHYYYGYGGYYGSSVINITDPAGNLVYSDTSNVLSGSYSSSRDRYYSYFYLDRGIYKPTDTISFWGYAGAHHQNTGVMPDSVFITFDPENLNIELEVPIDTFGAFHGEIELESVRSSQYYINAELRFPHKDSDAEEQAGAVSEEGDNAESTAAEGTAPAYDVYHLDYYYIDVKEYEKPTYVISSSTNQSWYTSGQQVTVTATPTFYDGTPLPNFMLEYQVFNPQQGNWSSTKTVTTDEKGIARFSFPAAQGSQWLYHGEMLAQNHYMIRIAQDGETITHTKTYSYIPTDAVYQGVLQRRDDGNLHFELNAYQTLPWGSLDAPLRETYDARRIPPAVLGEPYKDLPVRLEYNWWGSYDSGIYDSGSGVLDLVTDEVGTIHIADFFSDAQINREWDYFDVDLSVSLEDGHGNTLYSSYYYWTGMERSTARPSRGKSEAEEEKPVPPGYSLIAYNSQGETVTGEYYEYMHYDTTAFGAGQTMRFDLHYQGEAVREGGQLLYTLVQDGVAEYGVVQGTSLTLPQTARNSPSFNLTVAYFDGREVYPTRSMMVTLDRQSLVTALEVTPDRDSYRPGDLVRLQVKATDQNGTGVGGNLLISVVDESIFALKEQNITILNTLHGDIYYDNEFVRKYSTKTGDYTLDNRPGDEGKGSGESIAFYDSYRSNFKDTAAFLPVRTDSAGNATVQFQLPDNTTSWRITSLSVGDNLYAGQQRDNIISTLPFFISPVISPKYIAGDEVAILVQGHGTLLDEDSEIDYTVTITGDGINETLEASGSAYESQEINFGRLPMGEYTVVATAQYSGYSDTVELPLTVINSNLELVIHKKLDAGESLDIQAVRYPVVVTFYDASNEAFFDSIGSLMGHYCMVANQRMSRFVAKRALEERMDPASIPQYILEKDNNYASNMQNTDGGIGWTVGSASEPVLTAKVLLVAMDQFDLGAMTGYFRTVLQTSTNEMELAAAYLGLAAIGEPVDEEILALLDNQELALSGSAKAYLIAGLAYAEHPRAVDLYDTALSNQVRNMSLGFMPKYTYKDIPAIWIAASKLAPDDADAISSFLAKSYWRYDTLFECMIYVTNYDKEFAPRTISYEVNGTVQTINLGLQGQYSVAFAKSEFETLKLLSVPDGVKCMAYYVGEPGELGLTASEHIAIDKTVEALGDDTYKFTVKLRFTNEAPTGQYDISDWVPSNMRLYTVEATGSAVSYTEEGQKLYFTLQRSTLDKEVEIIYHARRTYEASAILDSVYIIHGDSGENASTEKKPLTN